MAYTWDSPSGWLLDKAETATKRDLQRWLKEIVVAIDSDTIQDLFQDEMDADGYFDEVTV